MRTEKYILTLLLLIPTGVYAQETDFSYQMILETKAEYRALDGNSEVNPGNRMGIDEFASLTQFYPVLKFDAAFGETNTVLQAEGLIRNYNLERDSTGFSFQELYTQVGHKDRMFFVFGKKRLDWGTGMIWNPTNFFIQKDPLRTQNRLEGLFMLNFAFLSGSSTFNFYIFPEKKFEDFRAAVKYDLTAGPVDAGLSFVQYGNRQQIGYEVAYGGSLFTAYSEGVLKNYTRNFRLMPGGELVHPGDRKKRLHGELVLGTMVSFNSRLSFSGEYRYRSDLPGRKEIGTYVNKLPDNPVLYDPMSIGKHTLFGNVEFRDTYARWSVSLRTFYDPVSRQMMLSPLGVVTAGNFQIEASAMFYNNRLPVFDFQGSLLFSCFF